MDSAESFDGGESAVGSAPSGWQLAERHVVLRMDTINSVGAGASSQVVAA